MSFLNKQNAAAAEEKAAERGKKNVPIGDHTFVPTFELTESKAKDSMIVVNLKLSDEYYDVIERITFKKKPTKLKPRKNDPPNSKRTTNDISFDDVISILKKGYKYSLAANIPAGADKWDIVKQAEWLFQQLEQFNDKPLQAVIRHRERVYEQVKDDGSKSAKRTVDVEVAYYGHANEDMSGYDRTSALIKLDPNELAKVESLRPEPTLVQEQVDSEPADEEDWVD
jgi:hypothetical protein